VHVVVVSPDKCNAVCDQDMGTDHAVCFDRDATSYINVIANCDLIGCPEAAFCADVKVGARAHGFGALQSNPRCQAPESGHKR